MGRALSDKRSGVSAENNVNIDLKKDFYMHGIVCGDAAKLQSFKPQVVITNTGEIEHGTYHYKSNYGLYSYTFKASGNGSDAVLSRETTTKKGSTEDTCIVKELKKLNERLLLDIGTERDSIKGFAEQHLTKNQIHKDQLSQKLGYEVQGAKKSGGMCQNNVFCYTN